MHNACGEQSQLLSAYEAARYDIQLDDTVLTLCTGQPLPAALEAWFGIKGIEAAAFISAANPRSRPMTAKLNANRHARLLGALGELDVRWLSGCGRDPAGIWEAEPSVLALQLTRTRAMQLALQFEQNAYLEVVPRRPVTLVLTAHWSRC